MTRIYAVVEGQSEEAFVRELLVPHYARIGIYVTPIIVSTSRGHKGGVVNYAKIRPQLLRLCLQDENAFITTMFDLYALPGDFPGKANADYPAMGSGAVKARFVEKALLEDISLANFIPNIVVHEFETLLFCEPGKFAEWAEDKVVNALQTICDAYKTPEDINEGPETAPSKRLLRLMPAFQKTIHGPLIAVEIGLDRMRQFCPHFNQWLVRIDALKS